MKIKRLAVVLIFLASIALASSFYVIPFVEYGAPFITKERIAFRFLPTLLYLYIECAEAYLRRKNKRKEN